MRTLRQQHITVTTESKRNKDDPQHADKPVARPPNIYAKKSTEKGDKKNRASHDRNKVMHKEK